MRVLGLDPGLQRTGWGVIEAEGTRLRGIACGTITSDAKAPLSERLAQLYDGLQKVLDTYQPDCA